MGSYIVTCRDPVENPFAVAKTVQQSGVTEVFELLRNARLALSENAGQLGHTAFSLPALSDQAQSRRFAERFQTQHQGLSRRFHKYIRILLYKVLKQFNTIDINSVKGTWALY